MPTRHPGSAARNQSQPCSDPEATPPTNAPMLQPNPRRAPQPISSPPIAAANSDFNGGHGAVAKGLLAAAAAMAPNSIPKSVRLDVSESTDFRKCPLGPGPLPESHMRQIEAKCGGSFCAPNGEGECHAPWVTAGNKNRDAQKPDDNSAYDIPA